MFSLKKHYSLTPCSAKSPSWKRHTQNIKKAALPTFPKLKWHSQTTMPHQARHKSETRRREDLQQKGLEQAAPANHIKRTRKARCRQGRTVQRISVRNCRPFARRPYPPACLFEREHACKAVYWRPAGSPMRTGCQPSAGAENIALSAGRPCPSLNQAGCRHRCTAAGSNPMQPPDRPAATRSGRFPRRERPVCRIAKTSQNAARTTPCGNNALPLLRTAF